MIRSDYEDLQIYAEGVVDARGRRGPADVPVHYKTVNLTIYIKTEESDQRLQKLSDLVSRFAQLIVW